MLNNDALRAWGANVDEGMVRCLNNEAFYLKLVQKSMQDPSFERLASSGRYRRSRSCSGTKPRRTTIPWCGKSSPSGTAW